MHETGTLDGNGSPLAATTPEPPKQGDCLFELEPKTSLSILKELVAYSWNTDSVTDLGLTSSHGIPRLGVHTLRHRELIMLINFHVRRLMNSNMSWSTISIDASNEERLPMHEHKRPAPTAIFVVGAYASGATYALDGTAQLINKDVGVGCCFTAPYATSKHSGVKFTIELHNRHLKRRASGEDLHLLSCLGFARQSTVNKSWTDLLSQSGCCPPCLLSHFFTSLLIEISCGESSAFGKMAQHSPSCLVVRITLRYDIMEADTLSTIMHLIKHCGFGSHILVWFAFRCVGGSQLQPLNIAKGDDNTRNLINRHQEQFMDHFYFTEPITLAVRNQGGKVSLELPVNNAYWKGTLITKWISKFDLHTTTFNGCMYGLTAPFGPQTGQLMLKGWKVATDMQPLLVELSLRCNHAEPHPAICGRNNSASENYPP